MNHESLSAQAFDIFNLTLQRDLPSEQQVEALTSELNNNPQAALQHIHRQVSQLPLVPQNVKGEKDIHTAMLEAYGSRTLARLYSEKNGLILWLFELELYKFNGYFNDGLLYPDLLLTCFQAHSEDSSSNCLTLVVNTNGNSLEFQSAVFNDQGQLVRKDIEDLHDPETLATILLHLNPQGQNIERTGVIYEPQSHEQPKSHHHRKPQAENKQTLFEKAMQEIAATIGSNQSKKQEPPLTSKRYHKKKLQHKQKVKEKRKQNKRDWRKRKK